MSNADLSGILVKIDRAKAHLDDFDAQCTPVIAACRDAIIRERDEQRSEYIFRFGQVPAIPRVLNAIIGDAVHNLRASLDYLAWQLVIATDGTPDEHTSFPVCKRRPRAQGGVRLPDIRPGVPVQVRKILDEVQPYKRAKPAHHELAILHQLDIGDKHHELLITILGIKSAGWFGNVEVTGFNFGPYDNGSEICRFAYSGAGYQAEFNPYISFTIRFSEPAAGPAQLMNGAAGLIRDHSLSYVENEVLPRFRRFF